MPHAPQRAFPGVVNLPPPPLNVFSLKLFGGAVLEGRRGPVTGRASHKRRLALLSVLAAARRPVARDRLIGLLWPESSTDSARHLLSESLYVLRKELGEGALVAAGDEVGLNGGVVKSDVEAFEAALEAGDLEAAAAAYRGAFLDAFYVADAPEFERWAEGERDRLARACARTLEALAERRETEGRPVEAAEWWRRLASHDPYSSRVALRLVKALDAAGERAAALRFAAVHARLLFDDLGVEPDQDFLECVQRLRAEGAVNGPPAVEVPAPRPDAARMVAESAASGPPPAAPAKPPPAGDAEAASPTVPDHPRIPARPPLRVDRVAYYGGLAGLILGFTLSVLPGTGPAAEELARPPYDPRQVAVLHFDAIGSNEEVEAVALGLTDGLIDRLGEVDSLRVISRNGVKPYRDGRVPFDSIVAALKVGSMVEGSVQRSGGRLRVTVRLVDANSAEQVGSRTIESPRGELFALQDSIADQVAGFLRVRLGQEIRLRERAAGTRSDAALRLLMLAERERDLAQRFVSNANPLGPSAALRRLATADSLAERAAATDRRWPEPLVLRGVVRLQALRLAADSASPAGYEKAVGYAEQALRLRPGDAAALELRGTARWRMTRASGLPDAVVDTLLRGAERDLRDALSADPSRAAAWSTLSQHLLLTGKLVEAESAARRALQEDAYLEALEPIIERLFHSSLNLARYDSAAAWCERGRRHFPLSWRFLDCQITLMGENTRRPPDVEAAWRIVAEADQLDPPARARESGRAYWPLYRRVATARVIARAGLHDSARAVVARARLAAGSDSQLVVPLLADLAYLYMLLDQRDSALAALEPYLEARDDLRGYIARDPAFQPLRDDPRFRALVTPRSPSAAPVRRRPRERGPRE